MFQTVQRAAARGGAPSPARVWLDVRGLRPRLYTPGTRHADLSVAACLQQSLPHIPGSWCMYCMLM